jgi:uncharacterized membrane protein YkgB
LIKIIIKYIDIFPKEARIIIGEIFMLDSLKIAIFGAVLEMIATIATVLYVILTPLAHIYNPQWYNNITERVLLLSHWAWAHKEVHYRK